MARRVKQALSPAECRMMTMEKFGEPDFEVYRPPLTEAVGNLFSWCDQLVFIGSTGMAVRGIAPWVKDKGFSSLTRGEPTSFPCSPATSAGPTR